MNLRGLQRLATALAVLVIMALGFVAPAFAQLSDLSKEGTITAVNGAVAMDTGGRQTVSVLLSGTWTATVVAEVSTDGGTTWESTDLYDISGRARAANTTGNGTFIIIGTGGMNRVRVKASAYTSGTITALLRASNGRPTIEVGDVTNAAPSATAFGQVVRTLTGTGTSADQVQGTAADGATAVGNPVQMGGKDGAGNIQAVLTDTGGAVQTDIESGPTGTSALQSQGTAADGAAAVGNPLQIGGKDGAGNAQAILTDTTGAVQADIESGPTGSSALQAQGTQASGSALVGNPMVVAGSAGANAVIIKTDSGGAVQTDIESGPTGTSALQSQGTAADGSAAVGSPVQIGGKDGSGNTQTILTDTGGAVQTDVESMPTGASAAQVQGTVADGGVAAQNPVKIAGKDGAGNVQDILTDTTGAIQADIESGPTGASSLQMQGAGANGAAVTGNPVLTAGSDGTNARSIKTDAGGAVQTDIESGPTGASALQSQGAAADGAAAAGNPVQVGGVDGAGNAQRLLTDTTGAAQVDVESIAAGTNYIGKVRKTDGTNDVGTFVDADSGAGTEYREGVVLRKMASGGSVEAGTSADPLRVDPTGTTTQPVSGTVTANAGTGTFTVGGTAADGAAASGNPVQVGGVDGAGNAQRLLTDTTGALQADIESIAAGNNNIGDVDVATIAAGDNNIGNVDVVTGPTGATAFQVQGTVADGGVAAQNPIQIGGKDGAGNIQTVLTDTTGAVQTDIESIAAGDNNIGNVDLASAIPAGTNYIGKVRPTDGTNDMTTLHDTDSGAGAQYTVGVSLRKAASGGSVEAGTTADPLRVDPTGTTTQPVSGTVTANAGTGNFNVVGPGADGAVASGNPVRIGGKDGSGNTQDILTDTGGAVQADIESGPTGTSALQFQGTQASGSALVGNPVVVAGSAGANAIVLKTDSGGAVQVDVESGTVTANAGTGTFTVGGTAADGVTATGNPVQMGGVDGSGNAQAVKTDTTGSIQVDIESGPTSGGALQMQGTVTDGGVAAQNPVQIGGVDGSANLQAIKTDTTGSIQVDVESMPTSGNATQVQGTVADGLTATGNPVQIAGADGSGNAQRILTDTGGAIQVDIEAGSSVSITGTATVDSELASAGALADGATNPTTSTIGALAHVFNGTTWDRLRDNLAAPTTQYRAAVATGMGTITLLNAVSSTGAGSASNLGTAHRVFGLQVSTTGAPTTVVVHLEGSNDAGSNWFKLGVWTLAAQTAGDIVEITGPPVQRIRANLTTLSGGAAPTVTANVTGL